MIRLKSLPAGFALPPQKPRTASKPRQRAKSPGKTPAPSERDFQRQVIQLAKLLGFKVAHFRASMNLRGEYQTAVAADGAGYPDLTIVGNGRILWVELKAERGAISSAQNSWINHLRANGAEIYVWRPRDWDTLKRILEHGP